MQSSLTSKERDLSFSLEDFIPYYVDIPTQHTTVYPSLPQESPQAFYQSIRAKEEFKSLAYDDTKSRNVPGSTFFKHQEFVARFLSPHTPYNRMLAIHAVGTGKCVHPQTIITLAQPVSIFGTSATISHLWEVLQGGMLIEDGTGEWSTPKETITVLSYNTLTNTIEPKRVKRLYRERVKTVILHYSSGPYHLRCTLAHKLCTPKGFEPKCKLGQQVMLVNFDNHTYDYHALTHVERQFYEGYVYDLEVEDHHTYVANGFVTHNTCLIADVGIKAIQQSVNRPRNQLDEYDSGRPRVIVLTKAGLVEPFINETANQCAPELFGLPEDIRQSTSKEIQQKRKEEKVREWFEVQTVTQFCSSPDIELNIKYEHGNVVDEECDKDQLRIKFSNAYLIIDEAHLLPKEEKAQEKTRRQYKILHYLIHQIKGLKVLLLTATPMTDEPYDLVNILNLILPSNRQITVSKAKFNSTWFDPDTHQLKNPKQFMERYLIGNISYLRSNLDTKVHYEGTTFPRRKIHHTQLEYLVMEPHQATVCKRVYQSYMSSTGAQSDSAGYGLAQDPIYCTNFVFPDGSFGTGDNSSSEEGERKWITTEIADTRSKDVRSFRCSPAFVSYLKANGSNTSSMLDQIKKCSIKCWYALQKIIENPTEKIFIYHEDQFGGGMMLLAALLQEFGFTNVPKGFKELHQLQRAKRFMISATNLPGPSATLRDELFTNPDNRYGEYCQVIIGGEKLKEGFNLFDVRKMFILSPAWNMSSLDQAMGRVLRFGGHRNLPPEKRNVTIYRLCALVQHPSENKKADRQIINYDEYIYQTAEVKDVKIKQIERLLKQAAVDCVNNKAVNVRPQDQPNTRECDYQSSCDITCLPEINTPLPVINDTYNRFYGEKESYRVIEVIRQMFRTKFSYLFEELLQEITRHIKDISISSILLARSLYSIIVTNQEIINKFGFPNYLREDRNLYFLTDDPSGSVVYSLQWYAAHPFPDTTLSFDQAQDLYYNKYYDSLMAILDKHRNQPVHIKAILENTPYHLSQMLIESIVQTFTRSPERLSVLSRSLYDSYAKHLLRTDDAIYHTIFKKPRKLLLSSLQWSDISNAEYEQQLKKSQDTRELVINAERAKQIGIEGYIPVDYDDANKFSQLKIKQLKLQRKLATGETDRRLDRWGTKCGSQPFTKKYNIFLLFKLTKLSQEYGLELPLQRTHLRKQDLEDNSEFNQFILPQIKLYDMHRILAQHLIDTKQAIPLLFSLKLTPSMKQTNKEMISSILGITKQHPDFRKEKLEETEAYTSGKLDALQLTVKEVVHALELYSQNIAITTALFKQYMGRNYSTDTDLAKQMTPEVIDVLSKAILLQDNDLCREIGHWLERNQLLGIN